MYYVRDLTRPDAKVRTVERPDEILPLVNRTWRYDDATTDRLNRIFKDMEYGDCFTCHDLIQVRCEAAETLSQGKALHFWKEIKEVRTLTEALPSDRTDFQDPDTILADILDDMDTHITGQAEELFQMYESSADTTTFEVLFEALTGESFGKYLKNVAKTLKTQSEYWKKKGD